MIAIDITIFVSDVSNVWYIVLTLIALAIYGMLFVCLFVFLNKKFGMLHVWIKSLD